jgi:hypothetical protein
MTSTDDWLNELTWVAMKREDEPEYDRIRSELIKVLRKLGGYEPGVDDIYVDEIARASVYLKKTEIFLDAGTEDTYSKMADTRLKVRKTIDDAMNQLAITRRQRLANKTEGDVREELKQALLRGLKHGRTGTK